MFRLHSSSGTLQKYLILNISKLNSRFQSGLSKIQQFDTTKPTSCLHADLEKCNVNLSSYDPETKLPYETLSYEIIVKSKFDLQSYVAQQEDDGVFISNSGKVTENIDDINIKIPPMVNVKFDLQESCNLVASTDLKCDSIFAIAYDGIIELNHVKTDSLVLESEMGDIVLRKPVCGNIEIAAFDEGSILANELKGPSIELSTENGDISTKDLHSDEIIVNSEAGHININSVHGQSTIDAENGNVFLGSVDGELELTASQGDVDVYLSKPDSVYIQSNKGTVNLFTSLDVSGQLHFESPTVEVDRTLNPLNEITENFKHGCKYRAELLDGKGSKVHVHAASGSVLVNFSSWHERLQSIFKKNNKHTQYP